MITGDIFTIGSLLAEYEDNLVAVSREGYKGIDMELSAVYRAGDHIGSKTTSVLFVSDLPLKKPIWGEYSQEDKDACSSAVDEVVRLSVDFIL